MGQDTQDAARYLLTDLGGVDGEISVAFGGLPDSVQVGVLRELSRPLPRQIDCTPEDVAQFREMSFGRINF